MSPKPLRFLSNGPHANRAWDRRRSADEEGLRGVPVPENEASTMGVDDSEKKFRYSRAPGGFRMLHSVRACSYPRFYDARVISGGS
jgi:hypothetical protein